MDVEAVVVSIKVLLVVEIIDSIVILLDSVAVLVVLESVVA